jgi:hypothetical protein
MSRTDQQRPVTLAQLLHAQVRDEEGRALGRVHDVRATRDREPAEAGQAPRYRIEGLIVGRSGVRARLGLHRARQPQPLHSTEPLPWDHVISLEPGHIVVRSDRTA